MGFLNMPVDKTLLMKPQWSRWPVESGRSRDVERGRPDVLQPREIEMSLKTLSVVSVAVFLAAVTDSRATTVTKISFDQLCARAEVVFGGIVTSVESRRDEDGDAIHTYTTFSRVEWIVGGDASDSYTLRQLGGCVGRDCLKAGAMPRFEIGRRYVLFVRGNHRVVCPVLGWWQGGFEVVRENGASPPTVRTFRGKRLSGIANGDLVVIPDRATRAPSVEMTLEQFVNEIRATRARASESSNPDDHR